MTAREGTATAARTAQARQVRAGSREGQTSPRRDLPASPQRNDDRTAKHRRTWAVAIAALTMGGVLYASGYFDKVQRNGVATRSAAAEATVRNFLSHRIAGNWRLSCSYFVPRSGARRQCLAQAASVDVGLLYDGSVHVVGSAADGRRALVAVTGKLCVSDLHFQGATRCVSNADPQAGLPTARGSFSEAYDQATSKANHAFSPWPCQMVAGHWYLTPVQS